MQNTEEPHVEPGAACRTPCCQFFGGSADFEVNLLALKEETDGLFWSYTVVQGTPSVCGSVAKSINEFSSGRVCCLVLVHITQRVTITTRALCIFFKLSMFFLSSSIVSMFVCCMSFLVKKTR